MLKRASSLGLLLLLTNAGCPGGVEPDAGRDALLSRDAFAAPDSTAFVPSDASSDAPNDTPAFDTGPRPLRVVTEPITSAHRFVPGRMFGGWGPHLGHLVRSAGALYWVDDLCDQDVPGDCDVNVNRRVGVFRREASGWTRIGTMPLTGIQQNTAALAHADGLRTYGVDVTTSRLVECTFVLASGASACATLPFPLGPNANYVGAARSPRGALVVWWTNVVDGGGGSFSYLVDYGGGWNGPRTGPIGGYNDCAYAHAAFAPTTQAMTFFGQVVSGSAPAWTFSTLVGEASLATTDAPAWASALTSPPADSIASTNDLFIDDRTGDAHLLARSTAGAVVYYHRPESGSWSSPSVVAAATYRARWLVTESSVAIISGPNTGGLELRRFARADLVRGAALPIASAAIETIALPSGFGAVLALYPEAAVTQADAVGGMSFGVVGAGRENEALYVAIEP
jgi:hypothetical protein